MCTFLCKHLGGCNCETFEYSRIDFFFKRSRAVRPHGELPPYFPPLAATVKPLYYPVKLAFLSALRNVSAAAWAYGDHEATNGCEW